MTAEKIILMVIAVWAGSTQVALSDFDQGLRAFGNGNFEEALMEWTEASYAGDSLAQFLLAQLYEQGRGVKADPVEAYAWYRMAATSGREEAVQAVSRLSRRLNFEQHEFADIRLSGLKPKLMRDADGDSNRTEPEAFVAGVDDFDLDLADEVQQSAPATPSASVNIFATIDPEGTADPPGSFVRSESLRVTDGGGSDAVLIAQGLLRGIGYDAGEPDGLMGRKTRLAVIAFKRDNGLLLNDKLDEETLIALHKSHDRRHEITNSGEVAVSDSDIIGDAMTLNEPVRFDSPSGFLSVVSVPGEVSAASTRMQRAISEVQEMLNSLGYPAGPVDGLLGEQTKLAVRAFRSRIGMSEIIAIDSAFVASLRSQLKKIAR